VNALAGTHNANVEAADEEGLTALMHAANNGHTDTVNALSGTHNANVEAADKIGWTALMHAAWHGHTDTVNALADTYNANVEVVNQTGETALMIASNRGHTVIVDTLRRILSSRPRDSQLHGDDSEATQIHPCTICFHNYPKVRFDPCGHTACRSCSRELRKRRRDCHLCNRPVSKMQKFFV
jgi:hypothetical protein